MERTYKTEYDFYIDEGDRITGEGKYIFTIGERIEHKKHQYDWYVRVAIEKANKVINDRHLLTSELMISYRWAIREGYNHMLDPNLKRSWDHPKNRNTIEGIKKYIKQIESRSEEEYRESFDN